MEFELFMALFHEHKDRTGHDVTKGGADYIDQYIIFKWKVECSVCMWLSTLHNKIQDQQYNVN